MEQRRVAAAPFHVARPRAIRRAMRWNDSGVLPARAAPVSLSNPSIRRQRRRARRLRWRRGRRVALASPGSAAPASGCGRARRRTACTSAARPRACHHCRRPRCARRGARTPARPPLLQRRRSRAARACGDRRATRAAGRRRSALRQKQRPKRAAGRRGCAARGEGRWSWRRSLSSHLLTGPSAAGSAAAARAWRFRSG